jgi:hypothetical protein
MCVERKLDERRPAGSSIKAGVGRERGNDRAYCQRKPELPIRCEYQPVSPLVWSPGGHGGTVPLYAHGYARSETAARVGRRTRAGVDDVQKLLEKAEASCLVTNSLRSDVHLTTEVTSG